MGRVGDYSEEVGLEKLCWFLILERREVGKRSEEIIECEECSGKWGWWYICLFGN